MKKKYNVALLCSGLGHINRGVETWTADLGRVLNERGVDVTVYKGSGKPLDSYEKVIPCLRRDSSVNKMLVNATPDFAWRLGLGSTYELEEYSFVWNALPELIAKQYDIIHTQDPQIANFTRKCHQIGLIKSKTILAHGTEEPFEFLAQFDHVQHLAPSHYEEAIENCGKKERWTTIANAVNANKFMPFNKKKELRRIYNIPEDAFVIISVAAVKKTHKRMNHLVNEIGQLRKDGHENVYLLIVGARTNETEEIEQQAKELLGDQVKFIYDLSHEEIPNVYNLADVFTLCSIKEMLGIVFLEAMACGVPCIAHKYPVFDWVIGPGGECVDMQKTGELAKTILKYTDVIVQKEKGGLARKYVIENFSQEVITDKVLNMYDTVLNN